MRHIYPPTQTIGSNMDDIIANRNRIIEAQRQLFSDHTDSKALCLDVGCGGATRPGWVGIDKYVVAPGVIKADMYKLPYEDGTVDVIHSSHSLEHLSLRRSHLALRDWFRALRSGGVLFLSMPDLDAIMRILLSPITPAQRRWYMYTLFGWQAPMGTPDVDDAKDDPGQYHCSGHSLQTITEELLGIGYIINESYLFEGYGTPGLYVNARKP